MFRFGPRTYFGKNPSGSLFCSLDPTQKADLSKTSFRESMKVRPRADVINAFNMKSNRRHLVKKILKHAWA